MTEGFKALPAIFFRAASGKEPVRDWLKSLSPADRKVVGDDIRDCEFAWPSVSRCAVPWAKGFSRFAPIFPEGVLPGFCS